LARLERPPLGPRGEPLRTDELQLLVVAASYGARLGAPGAVADSVHGLLEQTRVLP